MLIIKILLKKEKCDACGSKLIIKSGSSEGKYMQYYFCEVCNKKYPMEETKWQI